MTDLRHCPFCGEAKALDLKPQMQKNLQKVAWSVSCDNCLAFGPFFLDQPEEAADAWNRRGRQARLLSPLARDMVDAKRLEGSAIQGLMPCPFCESFDIQAFGIMLPFCPREHFTMSCNYCDAGGPMQHAEAHCMLSACNAWDRRATEPKKEAAVA